MKLELDFKDIITDAWQYWFWKFAIGGNEISISSWDISENLFLMAILNFPNGTWSKTSKVIITSICQYQTLNFWIDHSK